MKIGNLDINAIKVGGADCSVYLGDVKLYPNEEPKPEYPYTFYRVSRGGSGYTVECSASSADTITSAQTKSGLSKAQLSSTTATQTPVEVVFGDCCQTINSGACSGWTQLTSITISDNVENINYEAFYDCQKVSELSIGSGIKSLVGIQLFSNVGGSATTKPNLDLSKNEGLTISGTVFYYGSLNDITLPKNSKIYQQVFNFAKANSLKFGNGSVIYDASSTLNGAFASSNINSIDLNGVTSIGNYAFSKISGVTSINIPSSVTNMGNRSFASGNSITSAHIDCTGKLGNYTFESCSALTSVEFGENTTEIGIYAFQKCKNLTSVTIPSTISYIGECAFESCSGLTSVSIPNSITEIRSYTFAYCSKLTTLNIPSSVTKVGSYAFSHCSGLTSIIFNTVTPPTLDNPNAFEYTNNCVIYVPSESVEAYKSASEWSNVASRIQAIPT